LIFMAPHHTLGQIIIFQGVSPHYGACHHVPGLIAGCVGTSIQVDCRFLFLWHHVWLCHPILGHHHIPGTQSTFWGASSCCHRLLLIFICIPPQNCGCGMPYYVAWIKQKRIKAEKGSKVMLSSTHRLIVNQKLPWHPVRVNIQP